MIKMVPAMEGNRSKCHPEKTLLPEVLASRATMVFEGCHFDLSPDVKGTIFYIVPKNAQQGN
jgi:hypothetical protein